MKFVIDKNIPFLDGVFEPYGHVVYLAGGDIDSQSVADANVLVVRTRTKCDEHLLGGSKVEMVATATIGYDHIDVDYLASRGIAFATAAGCNAGGVLNYVATALVWLCENCKKIEPSQTTLGVIGVGNVGRLIAWLGEKCGFKVLCCDPPRQRKEGGNFVSLEILLSESDVVTCHVPLVSSGEDKTLGMASREFFATMRSGAVFINSSRGEVVVDAALCDALDSGHLSAAVIDTWNGEPQICKELLSKATLATPHIAGYSLQGKANGSAMVVKAVSEKFGLPLDGWYAQGVCPCQRDQSLSWDKLKNNALSNFDIKAQSDSLKASLESFESMRNNYNYRQEIY